MSADRPADKQPPPTPFIEPVEPDPFPTGGAAPGAWLGPDGRFDVGPGAANLSTSPKTASRIRVVARDLIQAPGDYTPVFRRRRVWILLGSVAFAVAPYILLALTGGGLALGNGGSPSIDEPSTSTLPSTLPLLEPDNG